MLGGTEQPYDVLMRDDDAFWAARRIAAFSDDTIRAIVHTGEFGDAAAERTMADIMIKRRDKILSAYLPAVNPIDHYTTYDRHKRYRRNCGAG